MEARGKKEDRNLHKYAVDLIEIHMKTKLKDFILILNGIKIIMSLI